MIPIQDVVPSGRRPVVTLALIGLNLGAYLAAAAGFTVPAPLAHAAPVPLLSSIIFLWLFGDNVEGRLGRVTFGLVYVAGGLVPGLGAAGGVTAVLGCYFVMLPQSRIFVLVPAPDPLVEVPAVFFLAVWAVLHLLQRVASPRTLWLFALAFIVGAVVARLRQPRIRW